MRNNTQHISHNASFNTWNMHVMLSCPLCSMDTINTFLALNNCMNVCPGPQELHYNSKHMELARKVCVTYNTYLVYLSKHIATG